MTNDLSVLLYLLAFVVLAIYAMLDAMGHHPLMSQPQRVVSYLLIALIAATRAALVERPAIYWEMVYIGRGLWLLLLVLYSVILARYIRSLARG